MASEDQVAKVHAALKILEGELRHDGLFLDSPPEMHSCGDHPGQGPVVIVIDCLVGGLAWSDRVQNPSRESIDDEFRSLQAAAERDAYEERRAEILRRLTAGESLFGDLP